MCRRLEIHSVLLLMTIIFAVFSSEGKTRYRTSLREAMKAISIVDSAATKVVANTQLPERSLQEIIDDLPDVAPQRWRMAMIGAPRIFSGFRMRESKTYSFDEALLWDNVSIEDACNDSVAVDSVKIVNGILAAMESLNNPGMESHMDSIANQADTGRKGNLGDYKRMFKMPDWLLYSLNAKRINADAVYDLMIRRPAAIDYADWDLPVPPKLPVEDTSFAGYIRSQWIPKPQGRISGGLMETEKINWIHDLNGGVQFSQAYISPNWYQGGNNSLSLLVNFLWHVQLNTIFHPNKLLDSQVSYKLGLTSTPQDTYHKYAISEDLFQWNFKAGIKAFERWFYSVTLQFKTQFFNTYGSNSDVRSASFLSPGDFNAGLGMTYSFTNKKKNLKFNASIAPISYNLKTCIDPVLDPVQFNIPAGRKFNNEIGSNAELTLDWKIISNIVYKSRLFLFSNYKYFQGDWENTLSFNINRFLSTQIYCHLRYDSSSDLSSGKWHHWMLKEILSFGVSYYFSTKV